MDEQNPDVELEKILSGSESEPTPRASTENGQPAIVREDVKTGGLSERATARIRQLNEENKRLREQASQPQPERSNGSGTEQPATDLDSALDNLGVDEASKKVLKEFGRALESQIENKYKPTTSKVREMEFDQEFSRIASAAPEIAPHREELLKTYRANPGVNLRALAGETLLEIRQSQIKPLESQRSEPVRDSGAEDLDNKSVDELFEIISNSRK